MTILKKVERQTFRAARIVNNLLEFARNRAERAEAGGAGAAGLRVPRPAGRPHASSGAIEVALGSRPPSRRSVLGCDGELQQVFTNLIVNAIDAMQRDRRPARRSSLAANGPLVDRAGAATAARASRPRSWR